MTQPRQIQPADHPAQRILKQGRVVVSESIYHQFGDDQPFSVERPFSYQIKSDEQPYRRRLKLTSEWQQLDTGWLDSSTEARMPGMICLYHEPEVFAVKPTPEQIRLAASRLIGIASELHQPVKDCPEPGIFYLPAGCSSRFFAVNAESLFLRCVEGECKVDVTIYPR